MVTGEDEGADEDGMVSLSSVGAGEVMYTFDTGLLVRRHRPMGDFDDDGDYDFPYRRRHERMEYVEITFTWEAGEPPLDMGTVTVSYASREQ